MTGDSGIRSSTLFAFIAAVVIGGSNFVAVKYSNEELEPTWGAALRFSLGTAIFFLIASVRRIPLPRGRALLGAMLYGGLGLGLAYLFLYYALVGLTAGTSSVIIAAAPLATLVLAVAHRQERFSLRGVVGGVLAIAGIGVLSGGSLGGELRLLYIGSALLAVLCIGESAVIIKGFPRAHPIATNAVGMATGAILLLVASFAFGDEWVLPSEPVTWFAVAWLVVAGSVGLFALYLFLIDRWTASATNYVITLMPIVAVTLGAVLADEQVTVGVIVGGMLVVAAVYVGALKRDREPAKEAAAVAKPEAAPTP